MMYNDNIYFSLYKKIYNDNKHFMIHENVFLVIRDDVSRNICCHYITTDKVIIHYNIFLVIQDSV